MTLNRRKFTKLSLIGGASFVASSGILFPKPAESFSLDFLVSNATSKNVFNNLLAYAGVKVIDAIFEPSTQQAIDNTQEQLEEKGFEQNKTPYGKVSNSDIMWSQERMENQQDIGLNTISPNPAFAIQNTENYYESPKLFSGATSVGIETASRILVQDTKLSPEQAKDILFPWREVFEDITSWQGDNDPTIGKNSNNVGLTAYRARQGEVIRRYDRVSPELGKITFTIDSYIYKGTITTNVKFA